MIYLLIAIALVSSFFIIFRYFSYFNVNSFHAITINYAIGGLTGLFINSPLEIRHLQIGSGYFYAGIILGFLFLLTFFLMSETVNKVSVSVSSIANKTSLVIPTTVSILFFPVEAKELSWINYIGIGMALPAIFLASGKTKDSPAKKNPPAIQYGLPFLVFFLGGIIDTLLNFTNFSYQNEPGFSLFPVVSFFGASLIGFCIIFIKRQRVKWQSLAGGLILGIPNYFSIYYLLLSLKAYNNDGAIVFPVLNTGIIILTAFLATLLFREKLSLRNIMGIILAALSILLIFQ